MNQMLSVCQSIHDLVQSMSWQQIFLLNRVRLHNQTSIQKFLLFPGSKPPTHLEVILGGQIQYAGFSLLDVHQLFSREAQQAQLFLLEGMYLEIGASNRSHAAEDATLLIQHTGYFQTVFAEKDQDQLALKFQSYVSAVLIETTGLHAIAWFKCFP